MAALAPLLRYIPNIYVKIIGSLVVRYNLVPVDHVQERIREN